MFLVLLVFVLLILLVAEPYAERKIIKTLGRDSVKVGYVDVKWVLPGITFRDISYKSVNASGINLEGKIGILQIRGIQILKALSGNFHFSKLEIRRANLRVNKGTNAKKSAPFIFSRDITVDAFLIKDAEMTFTDSTSKHILKSTGMQVMIRDTRFSDSDTFRISDISHIDFSAERISVYETDSMNTINLFRSVYDISSRKLSIDSLSLIPRYPQYEYTSRFDFQTDRIELILTGIEIRDLPPGNILKGDLISSGIIIDSLSIDAFRDKRKAFKHENKKMLQEIIYSYPGKLRVDSVTLNNGYIKYSEREEDTEEAGFIFFNHVGAVVLNLNNDSSLRNQERYLTIHSKGRLMDESNVEITYKAGIYDPDHSFSITGSMDDMNLSVLNTITEKNGFVSISGTMRSLEFEFTADTESADGSLKFLYDSLAIKVEGKGPVKDKLATWIGNYKLQDSNPLPGDEIRTGKINYKRDPERFLFNYIIKSLMTGVKSSVVRE